MIIDSHAHHAHASFSGSFRYLIWEDNWTQKEGTLENLLGQMEEKDIAMSVEPGISLDFHERIIAEIAELRGRTPEEVVRIKTENAIRLYRLPGFDKLD